MCQRANPVGGFGSALRKMPIIAVSDSGNARLPLDSRTVHASRPIEYHNWTFAPAF